MCNCIFSRPSCTNVILYFYTALLLLVYITFFIVYVCIFRYFCRFNFLLLSLIITFVRIFYLHVLGKNFGNPLHCANTRRNKKIMGFISLTVPFSSTFYHFKFKATRLPIRDPGESYGSYRIRIPQPHAEKYPRFNCKISGSYSYSPTDEVDRSNF